MGEALVTLSLTLGHEYLPLIIQVLQCHFTVVTRLRNLDRPVCLELFYDGIEALTKRTPMK